MGSALTREWQEGTSESKTSLDVSKIKSQRDSEATKALSVRAFI